MSLSAALATFKANSQQCTNLISNAHQVDANGTPVLPSIDQKQITVAAFLNLFVAWETFLEESLAKYMTGLHTITGKMPTRYVSPPTLESAKLLVIGVQRYFDYGNIEYVKRIVNMYFYNGYPFEPHLSSITTTLSDLRTMRNSSAHVTSTTQTALEALAQRIFSTPKIGIDLYTLLMSIDPRSTAGSTVFVEYQLLLETTAELIANG